MKKYIVTTPKAPSLPGVPYSPAVKVGNLVFTSGQVPDDPSADIQTQTKQTLEKVKALVEAAGASMDNVVKCTVFLKNLEEFAEMNKIYVEYFSEKPPARSCVEVSKLVKNFKVEIEAIALASA